MKHSLFYFSVCTDDKQLKDCGLKEGSRLNLLRRSATSVSASTAHVSTASQPTSSESVTSPLQDELLKFLLRQNMPPGDAHKIIKEFMKVSTKS
jgi:hypothetical protein